MKHAVKVKKKKSFLRRNLALILAMMIMLSTVFVSGLSLTVFAASGVTSANQTIYLNLKSNSLWAGTSGAMSVKFAKADGTVVKTTSATKKNDGLFHIDAASAIGATQIQLAKDSTPVISSYPVGSNLPDTVPKSGNIRVYLNASNVSTTSNGKQKFSEPRIYAWVNSNPSDKLTDWSNAPKMTNLSGDIWYYDLPSKYDRIIFCQNINGGGRYQTGDLSNFSMVDGCSTAYFDGSNWRSSQITTFDITDIYQKNIVEYYMGSDGKFTQSKYLSTLTPEQNFANYPGQYDLKTVYVYYSGWSTANELYAYLDYGDPYRNKITLEKTTQGAYTVFKGKIPVGAKVRFAPNSSTTTMNVTEYPTTGSYDGTGYSETTATYYMIGTAQGWDEFKNVGTISYDAIVPNNFSNSTSNQGQIVGVDATYIDYLSDFELERGYLCTRGTDSQIEEMWYQFDNFNKYISGKVANTSNKWKYPLYFGNLFKGDEWYNTFKSHVSGLNNINNYDDNYYYAVNNSNGMKWGGGNFNQSIQGLAGLSLNSDGNLTTFENYVMPYFDVNTLTTSKYSGKNTNDVAKVFKSSFPFIATTDASSGVTTYSFDSKDGKNNVYFAWDGTTPKYINYGEGKDYAVKDYLSSDHFGGSSDGYGIFPFNNNSKTKTNIIDGKSYTRGGYDNLDYGFGIRLDIDFKVPENGLLSNGEHVTFDYSGDDDLWVYIGEKQDGSDGKLVLDLGGDHKESKGYIDFNTMKAYVDDSFNFYSHDDNGAYKNSYTSGSAGVSVPSDELWVKTNEQYFCIWTWPNNGGGRWETPYSYDSSAGIAKFKIASIENNGIFCKWQNLNDGKLTGDLSDLKSYGGTIRNENSTLYTGSSTSKTISRQFNNGVQLDPNKTYHMTVFYMERGESESNFSVGFTMTPANNDLQVVKNLVTEETDDNGVTTKYVIDEIAKDLEENEVYNYNITGPGTATTNGKSYSFYSKEKPAVSERKNVTNNSFSLTNGDKVDFNNQFDNNDQINVTESMANKALKYETEWVLTDSDNLSDPLISTQKNVASSFNLINKDKDESKDTSLLLTYNNKPKTSTLDITKKVYDEDKITKYDTEQQFTFNVKLDLDGNGSIYQPKTYPLTYKKYDASGEYINTAKLVDGKFYIRQGEKVELLDVPVGANYTVTEDATVGYVFDGSLSDNMSGTIGSETSVTAVNIAKPVKSEIEVTKTLDNAAYSNGSAFKYTLTGFSEMTLSGGKKTLSTDDVNVSVSTTGANGSVKFENLRFVDPGTYRYQIVETLNVEDKFGFYNMDTSVILVEIIVDESGEPQNPQFIVLSKSEYDDVKADIKQVFDNADSYGGYKDSASFKNTTEKAKIVINKENPAGNKIDAEFAVIRVSKAEGITGDDVKKIMDNDALKSAVVANSGSTSGGKIEFNNLSVYQDGSKMYNPDSDAPVVGGNYLNGTYTPQIYCVFEYKASSGYNLNSTPYYVTFPLKADGKTLESGYYEDSDGYVRATADDSYVFSQTFDYTNYPVVVPNASGEGISGWINLGLMIIGFAGLLTAAYFITGHINRKRRMARAERRK